MIFHGTATGKAEVIQFDKEEQALIKKHCLQCSIKNRMKVELVRCKEITKADQTERVNSDSELSLTLLNVFPVTRCKAKFTLPPQQKDKETSFLYVDWTKMYKEDRFFGSVYHKLTGDKPYNSEGTSDFKIQGDRSFWQGRICVPDCLILYDDMSNIGIRMRHPTDTPVFWSRSYDTECTHGTSRVPVSELPNDASNVRRTSPRIKRQKDY